MSSVFRHGSLALGLALNALASCRSRRQLVSVVESAELLLLRAEGDYATRPWRQGLVSCQS
jgi:hypothetical protein